jgi:hypothetical protein
VRKRSIALVAVITLGTLGGSVLALAQTATRPPARKIFGYQDSKTGVFHPAGKSIDPSALPPAATTTYAGTIEATITITLKTALPKGDVIVCSVDAVATSEGTAGSLLYDDDAASAATVSGATATCKVNIPFSWVLFTPSTTTIDSLTADLEVVMYSPTANTINELLQDFAREHSQPITINGGKPGDGPLAVTAAVTL